MAKTVLLGLVVRSCKQGFGEPQADKQACHKDSLNILQKKNNNNKIWMVVFLIVEWYKIKM